MKIQSTCRTNLGIQEPGAEPAGVVSVRVGGRNTLWLNCSKKKLMLAKNGTGMHNEELEYGQFFCGYDFNPNFFFSFLNFETF